MTAKDHRPLWEKHPTVFGKYVAIADYSKPYPDTYKLIETPSGPVKGAA